MSEFLYSAGLIVFSLFCGYSLQQLVNRQILRLPLALGDLRKLLQKIALWFVVPMTMASTIWIINIDSVSLTAFPLLGMIAFLLGGGFAIIAARFLQLQARQTGALFASGYFSNVGSIGGLVGYVFIGEKAFALASFYHLLQPITYYMIGFSIAKSYSVQNTAVSFSARLKTLGKDPFILIGTSSLLIGGLLNLSGLERPAFFSLLNAVFIPLGTMVLLISIGLALRFQRVTGYWRESLIVALIKFLLVPLCTTLIAYFLGYRSLDNGVPLKTILILSSTPVAFNALVATSIYDLDLDLANSCFLFTTIALVVTLPILYALLQLI